ncbi:MAG: LPS export ABC transporter periplasmic protein LptC [Pseudomonadota bacterium]
MNARSLLLLIILMSLAIGSAWLVRPIAEDADDRERPPPIRSGYYVLDAMIYSGNAGTRGAYEIRAREAQQSAAGEPILLQDIEVNYTGDATLAWDIQARTAALSEASGYLEMAGSVVATRRPGGDAQPLIVTTERLAFDPQTDLVSSDERVRFAIGTGILEGTGLRVHLSDDTLALQSNVRGEYAP